MSYETETIDITGARKLAIAAWTGVDVDLVSIDLKTTDDGKDWLAMRQGAASTPCTWMGMVYGPFARYARVRLSGPGSDEFAWATLEPYFADEEHDNEEELG